MKDAFIAYNVNNVQLGGIQPAANRNAQRNKAIRGWFIREKSVLILIAGKQRSLRNALKGFLQTRPGYDVAGTVANKEALFTQVETKSPDLLILDEDFTQLLVEQVIIPLRQLDPCPQILVLGRWSESKRAYLDAGSAAFVEKADPPKSLLTAIERIRLWRNSA